MKITKNQLRRIIKEEKQKLFEGDLNEQAASPLEEAAQMVYYALLDVEDELVDRGVELRMGEFAKAIEQAMQRFK